MRVVDASGETSEYVITLTRYELESQFDAVVPARWIITGVEPVASGS